MLPSENHCCAFVASGVPPCTNPMSTLYFGSCNRWRFSTDPCDSTIFNVTPLLRSRSRYRSAYRSKLLPAGPLVIVIVRGGEEWMNQKIVKNSTTKIKMDTSSDQSRLNPKYSEKIVSIRANHTGFP